MMLSSLPVYRAISSPRPLSITPRTTSIVWYLLNGATLIAATPSISQKPRQNSYDNKRPPDRRLKVEAAQRDLSSDGAAVVQQLGIGSRGQRGQAEESDVVTGLARELRFGYRLLRRPAHAGDLDDALPGAALELSGDAGGEAEHGLEKTDVRVSNGELGGVDADRDPPAPASQ